MAVLSLWGTLFIIYYSSPLIPSTKFENISKVASGGYLVEVSSFGDPGESRFAFHADAVVNSAGLYSDQIAMIILRDKCPASYRLHYWKGIIRYSEVCFTLQVITSSTPPVGCCEVQNWFILRQKSI
jgi:hypothetical protein